MKESLKPAISQNDWLDKSESVALKIKVRPYSMKELCQLYNLSNKAMNTVIAPFTDAIGKRQGHFYTVRQVEIIFMNLGIPYDIKEGE